MTISISLGAAIDLQSPQPMHSPFSTISLSDKGPARDCLMRGLSSRARWSSVEPRCRILDRLARPRGVAGGARNEAAKARLHLKYFIHDHRDAPHQHGHRLAGHG